MDKLYIFSTRFIVCISRDKGHHGCAVESKVIYSKVDPVACAFLEKNDLRQILIFLQHEYLQDIL